MMNQHAQQVIEALGGVNAVARLFEIAPPSVSDWQKKGIPRARVMFLAVAKKRCLKGFDLKAATAPKPSFNSTPPERDGCVIEESGMALGRKNLRPKAASKVAA